MILGKKEILSKISLILVFQNQLEQNHEVHGKREMK